jgi:hypothetical protein
MPPGLHFVVTCGPLHYWSSAVASQHAAPCRTPLDAHTPPLVSYAHTCLMAPGLPCCR